MFREDADPFFNEYLLSIILILFFLRSFLAAYRQIFDEGD
jgi:hypothetical protein